MGDTVSQPHFVEQALTLYQDPLSSLNVLTQLILTTVLISRGYDSDPHFKDEKPRQREVE